MILEFESKEFELPKWTMKIAKMQDDVEKEVTNEMLYKKSYEFVKAVIQKSDLDVILDGKTLDTLDLIKLNNLYKLICAKYLNAMQEVDLELANNKLDKVSSMVDTMEKMANASEKLK